VEVREREDAAMLVRDAGSSTAAPSVAPSRAPGCGALRWVAEKMYSSAAGREGNGCTGRDRTRQTFEAGSGTMVSPISAMLVRVTSAGGAPARLLRTCPVAGLDARTPP
jgi:hypothetical protein